MIKNIKIPNFHRHSKIILFKMKIELSNDKELNNLNKIFLLNNSIYKIIKKGLMKNMKNK